VIVVDTTVLVYAVGAQHPYREACRALVAAVSQGVVQATTTVEVVQEFAHVRARRRGRDDAGRLASSYADLLGPLTVTRDSHLRAGLELWRRHPDVGCFDAVLAAVAHDIGASAVVSADQGFATIEGIHHVLADDAGVAAVVGS